MNDESALLAAIIAHPGEDTPRLAYADWLDENDAPIQADFVRTQCRLAACSAADPDYPDLLERHAEVVARFGPIAKMTVPELPPGFAFNANLQHDADNFRRGFLSTVQGDWAAAQMGATDAEIEQVCAGLPKLIATTTARGLSLTDATAEQLARVLAAPGAEALTELEVLPTNLSEEDNRAALRAVADAKAAPNLERLTLYMTASAADLAPLAGANFARLTHVDLPRLTGPVRDLRALTGAKWFRGLRSVRAGASERPLESALLAALAKLSHLETFDLRFQHVAEMKALGSARGFRALARLTVWPGVTAAGAGRLAKGTFPRLAELELWSVRSSHLAAILKAPWFTQLRVLSLRRGALGDKSVVALAKSAAAANLRILRFDDISVGKAAFAALGDGGRLPNLTTLELDTSDGRKMKAASMAAFAKALSLPRLRHLNLSGWPLGDTGAKALAANPALANLTRLAVARCRISEKGFAALVRSPHLQRLIELDATGNKLKTAAALRNTTLLPRLAAARLADNAIPPAAYRELHAARGLVV